MHKMEKKDLIPWGEVIYYLKNAALSPQQREEMIIRALQELLSIFPAVGTALIWPCQDSKVPWKLYYVGTRQQTIRRWLTARIGASLDETIGVLQHDLSNLSDMPFPHLISLQPAPLLPDGLWIVWATQTPLSKAANDCLERIRLTLEALIEIESSEEQYFSSNSPLHDRAMIKGIAEGDAHALSIFLGLTRLVGKAEFTFWGRAYEDVVEITTHSGAIEQGFGLTIPHGRGAGGRIAAYGIPLIVVEDYRNSPFRDPSVSHIVDGEQVRSAIAVPVRHTRGQEYGGGVGAVLYVTHRTPKPFSLAERLLVQRLARQLEPLPPAHRPTSFLSPDLAERSSQKESWYDLVLHANRIESLETWIDRFIKGTSIVTDNDGDPYVFAHTEQLHQMRAAFDRPREGVQILPLKAPGVTQPGQVYLRSAIQLPPRDWPDFFADLVIACNLVITRMEQAHDHLARQREQWLQALLQEKPLPQISQDGYRLGLPIEKGQLWVIAWSTPKKPARQSARKRMFAENIVLEHLKSPLLFFGDDIGVILLDEHTQQQPCKLYDALLTQCTPHPLWIVYGARYHSPQDLKITLTYSMGIAQKARREGHSEYLLDIQLPGLESLLENPRLTEDLNQFAGRLLAPLLEHDNTRGTDLTTTFVLAQTLGSAQAVAEELAVHVNTIRYRLHKVEDILGIEQASPRERTAWALASFIWKNRQQLS
jgi:sugar diacid utilization regulator